MKNYIIGYDPGGNGKHGLAILEVREENDKWMPIKAEFLDNMETVSCVIAELEQCSGRGRFVAAGIDTPTAWSMEESGMRPADRALRKHYSKVCNSVVIPNGASGAMVINGSIVLKWILDKEESVMVTEAHPKVLFFALHDSNRRHPWARLRAGRLLPPADKKKSKLLLLKMLNLQSNKRFVSMNDDHCFDALLAALAALKGCNGEWGMDLHEGDQPHVIHPFGRTHYWWPKDIKVPATT